MPGLAAEARGKSAFIALLLSSPFTRERDRLLLLMFWLYTNVMSMVFARKGNDNQSQGREKTQQMMVCCIQEIVELRVYAVNF